MKDWLIIIGFLLILLVLADGIRRKRNERNGNIKVSRSLKKSLKQQAEYEDDVPAETPSYTSELPNGGARVVGQRDPSVRIPSIEKKPQAKSYLEKHPQHDAEEPVIAPRVQREPQQASLNLGQSVPMLMESVEDSKPRASSVGERIEPSFTASRDEDLDEDYDDLQDDRYEGEDYERDDHPYTRELQDDHEREVFAEDEPDYIEEEQDVDRDDDDRYEDDEYSHEDEYDEDEEYENDEPHSSSATQQNFAEKQPAEPEEVLIINVMAHKGEMFNGGDLLDVILKCGMRYGSMDIFHRHSDAKGEGALLFSMANMVKPGTFGCDGRIRDARCKFIYDVAN